MLPANVLVFDLYCAAENDPAALPFRAAGVVLAFAHVLEQAADAEDANARRSNGKGSSRVTRIAAR